MLGFGPIHWFTVDELKGGENISTWCFFIVFTMKFLYVWNMGA
jgi:hypothetical protein